MRFLVSLSLAVQFAITLAVLGLSLSMPVGMPLFAIFVFWQTAVFFMIGMTIGNLNALAMEPLGHMAGTAASVMGAISTVGGAALATPIGLSYDGTMIPLALGIGFCVVIASLLMRRMHKLERTTAPAE